MWGCSTPQAALRAALGMVCAVLLVQRLHLLLALHAGQLIQAMQQHQQHHQEQLRAIWGAPPTPHNSTSLRALQAEALEMLDHGFTNYLRHAFPQVRLGGCEGNAWCLTQHPRAPARLASGLPRGWLPANNGAPHWSLRHCF